MVKSMAGFIFGAALTTVSAGLSAAPSTTPAAGDPAGVDQVTVQAVTYRGRPPFRRRLVTAPVVDVAALEPTAVGGETVMVNTTEFRGRPPFRRTRAMVPVVDAAAAEPVAQKPRRARRALFRGRPPFGR